MKGLLLPLLIGLVICTVHSQQKEVSNVSLTELSSGVFGASLEEVETSAIPTPGGRSPTKIVASSLDNRYSVQLSQPLTTSESSLAPVNPQTPIFNITTKLESHVETRLAEFATISHNHQSSESSRKSASESFRYVPGLRLVTDIDIESTMSARAPIIQYDAGLPIEMEPVAPGLPTDNINGEQPSLTTHQEVAFPIFEDEEFINKTIQSTVLCGYPPYNDRVACRKQNVSFDPLSKCESAWRRDIFGMAIVLFASAIICVNSLIPAVVVRNSDMRTHYDLIKVSLAIADLIIGILMFTSVLPNMVWIRNLSEEEVMKFSTAKANSATAIIVGSLLTITMEASLLHLCFMSIERFLVIKCSFWSIHRKRRSIVISLVGIWIVSILAAIIPALFPQHFVYELQPALLIYMLTMQPAADGSAVGGDGLLYTLVTLVLPYSVMVSVCVATGIVSYKKLKSTVRFVGHEPPRPAPVDIANAQSKESIQWCSLTRIKQNKERPIQPEIAVFITIIIMICAFTFTLLPFGIVVVLFLAGVLDCGNYTIPYVAAFYFGLLNSLANGIIYSARDPKFRKAVKGLFCKDIAHQEQRLYKPMLLTGIAYNSSARTHGNKRT